VTDEHEVEACPVCEDGASLEADGICSACGRVAGCPACADDDCTHLTERLWYRAIW
jgi:hypothetical protein